MSFHRFYERPPMYPKQEKAFFNDKRYSLVEGSTKSGKTHGLICWLFEQALLNGKPNRNYWWIAPVSSQAEIAFRRMKEAIPIKDLYSQHKVQQYITLANGATIWFKTAEKPDNLYGEDVYAAVIDEASRVREDSWLAVRSTLTATKGPVRIIGNVKGRSNWFYRMCRMAQEGHPEMYYDKITAVDAAKAGVIEWQEILDAKNVYPDHVFRELYLAEPADDHGNPFGEVYIEKCIFRTEDGKKTMKLPDTRPVAWGWDVAKSMNWTVGIGLDSKGNVCRFHRWRDNWDATIKRIASLVNGDPAYVDSTGGGDPVEDAIQRLPGGQQVEGFKFSRQSKQDLMVLLATAIQKQDIGYPLGPIVDELLAFEYDISPSGNVLYSSPKGVHDDCVDALAMAYKKLDQAKSQTIEAGPLEMTRNSPWRIS